MKIIADKDIPYSRSFFSTIGEVTLLPGHEINPRSIIDADLLIVRTVTLVNEMLLANSKVKCVATPTSGHDHIDLDYLHRRDIGFVYAPGSNAYAVAEYILSVLFVLSEQQNFTLTEKNVAIIGCGYIGAQVLSFLQAIGVECFVYDPPLRDAGVERQFCDLNDVFKADIITLHVPLTEQGQYATREMINDTFLAKLNKDVILINTARGNVIDEQALLKFMQHNQSANVVLDVWAGEPQINVDLLSRVKLGTPHIAGYSSDGKWRATRMIFEQICDYFSIEQEKTLESASFEKELVEINLTDISSDIEAIQLAVMSSYDVRGDSASLAPMLGMDSAQRSQYFTDLRNSYPMRREFNSMKITLLTNSDSLKQKLTTLGFEIETISE